jgi:hypothetical protein
MEKGKGKDALPAIAIHAQTDECQGLPRGIQAYGKDLGEGS